VLIIVTLRYIRLVVTDIYIIYVVYSRYLGEVTQESWEGSNFSIPILHQFISDDTLQHYRGGNVVFITVRKQAGTEEG
jgi:hypothetical protein